MPDPSTLAQTIAALCPSDGSHATAIPGLFLTRSSTATIPRQTLDRAVFCVVAQGAKCALLHEQRLRYDPEKYLIVSLDLPLVAQIEEASRERPFLGLSLVLDFDEISTLLPQIEAPRDTPDALPAGLAVGQLDPDLLDAVTRLTRLLTQPRQISVLAPLIRREIYFKLLLSPQSGLLRRLASDNGRMQRIAAGLAWIRRNAARPLRMQELAREMGMSPSTMHSWFRSVTSMSPLQFQKQLRLQDARRLMLLESLDASSASRRVGYESPSQFSREYSRLFGAPPLRDIERLRKVPGSSL